MSTVSFDTHTFVKRLTDAGMPELQAEILASEQSRLIDGELATKRDLTETALRLEYRLTMRFGTMLAVAVAAITALVKLL